MNDRIGVYILYGLFLLPFTIVDKLSDMKRWMKTRRTERKIAKFRAEVRPRAQRSEDQPSGETVPWTRNWMLRMSRSGNTDTGVMGPKVIAKWAWAWFSLKPVRDDFMARKRSWFG